MRKTDVEANKTISTALKLLNVFGSFFLEQQKCGMRRAFNNLYLKTR